jgi:prepilin-type N-terminal cleavage/methylation domain-containing protein
MGKRAKRQPPSHQYREHVRFNQMKRQNQGFTLIELLVVLTIIGILIGLSIFGLIGTREGSRDAKRKADLELIRSGLELYRSDCGAYPRNVTYTTNWPNQITGGTAPPASPPSSCVSGNVYVNVPMDPAYPSRNYSYISNASGTTYVICASLEQSTDTVTGCASCTTTCNYKVTNP